MIVRAFVLSSSPPLQQGEGRSNEPGLEHSRSCLFRRDREHGLAHLRRRGRRALAGRGKIRLAGESRPFALAPNGNAAVNVLLKN
jgi:hypothetical protein